MEAWPGTARLGMARRGVAWQGWAGKPPKALLGFATERWDWMVNVATCHTPGGTIRSGIFPVFELTPLGFFESGPARHCRSDSLYLCCCSGRLASGGE